MGTVEIVACLQLESITPWTPRSGVHVGTALTPNSWPNHCRTATVSLGTGRSLQRPERAGVNRSGFAVGQVARLLLCDEHTSPGQKLFYGANAACSFALRDCARETSLS